VQIAATNTCTADRDDGPARISSGFDGVHDLNAIWSPPYRTHPSMMARGSLATHSSQGGNVLETIEKAKEMSTM